MNAHIPCVSCLAPCCFRHIVAVTGYDAWVISSRLHLPMEEFLLFGQVPGQEKVNFRLEPGGPGYVLALRKKRRRGKAQGWPCIFLLELPGGYNRCGIYPHRPHACQIYPFTVRNGVVLLKPDNLCPPRGWNLAEVDHAEIRDRVVRFTMEYDIYGYVVRHWNRFVDSGAAGCSLHIRAYLGYLSNVYAALDQARAAVPPDTSTEVVRRWGEAAAQGRDPLECEEGTSLPHGLDPLQDWLVAIRAALKDLVPVRETGTEAVTPTVRG